MSDGEEWKQAERRRGETTRPRPGFVLPRFPLLVRFNISRISQYLSLTWNCHHHHFRRTRKKRKQKRVLHAIAPRRVTSVDIFIYWIHLRVQGLLARGCLEIKKRLGSVNVKRTMGNSARPDQNRQEIPARWITRMMTRYKSHSDN